MNDTITPDDAARHDIIIANEYPVATVAGIAAGCRGKSHHARVIDALQLLKAAEEITDAWAFQHEATEADDTAMEMERLAAEIIAEAKDDDGGIVRSVLCQVACIKEGHGESDDTALRKFTAWVDEASATSWKWAYFRTAYASYCEQRDEELQRLRDQLSEARLNEQAAAKRRDIEAAKRKREMIEQEIADFQRSEPSPDNWRDKANQAWDALGKDQQSKQRKAFGESFESGTKKRVMKEPAARHFLLGASPDFDGFISYLRGPSIKAKPTPPRRRNKDGTFVKTPRDAQGRIKKAQG